MTLNVKQRIWLTMAVIAVSISVVFAPFLDVTVGKGGLVMSMSTTYEWAPFWAPTSRTETPDATESRGRLDPVWIGQIVVTGAVFGLLVIFPPTRQRRNGMEPRPSRATSMPTDSPLKQTESPLLAS